MNSLNICRKYSIRPMFVFFDDCWNPGRLMANNRSRSREFIIPAGQDPSCSLRKDTDFVSFSTRVYQKDIVRTYAHDDRILMWDLYNEPGNSKHEETSLPLLTNVFSLGARL